MSAIILYQTPAACSRVTLNALEEIGLDYEDRALSIVANQQRSAEYLAINPKGKVPALMIDGRLLTESPAILQYLHRRHPEAGLLPDESRLGPNEGLEDLVWCGAHLHPIMRQIRAPQRYTAEALEAVKANGMAQMSAILAEVAGRLSGGRWWYGADWSILDVYLCWIYSTVAGAGLDLSPWPALADHTARVRARPSFQRALAREQAALERHRIELPPGMVL